MESPEDDDTNPDLERLEDALDVEMRNTELQELFNKKMKHIAKMESHSRVAVLLIDWELEEKDYLDTAEEVDRLAAVLRDYYNFNIHKRRLHTKKGKSAKHQMNKHLSDFVLEEDDEDTLLIIYYAGHGLKGEDEKGLLRLAGGSPKKGDKSLKQIVWEQAERVLDDTRADRLLIFDCCYAGQLARSSRAANTKIFDFLGATQRDSTAISPGPQSFTTALTWALKDLAHEKGFTTAQLLHKITEAEHFPADEQVPVVSERGEPSLRRLKIAPLPKTPRAASPDKLQDQKTAIVEFSVNLQFLFSKCPTEPIIDELTRSLRQLVKATDSPLQQVLWRGLFSENALQKGYLDFSHVARRMLYKLRRKSLSHKLRFRPLSAPHGGNMESPADTSRPFPEIAGDENQLRYNPAANNLTPRTVLLNGESMDSSAEVLAPVPDAIADRPSRKRRRVE